MSVHDCMRFGGRISSRCRVEKTVCVLRRSIHNRIFKTKVDMCV